MKAIRLRATVYIRDSWLSVKKHTADKEVNLDNMIADFKSMGKQNLFALMIDFYDFPIIPIYDL